MTNQLSSCDERVRSAAPGSHDGGMTVPIEPTSRTTYRSVFASGQFRVLFAAFAMYVLGFEFEILGLSVLVFTETRSPTLAALAFSMGFAPQAVGGALFTSLADRLPPRAVIGTGLLTRAVPGLVIGLWPGLPVAAMLAMVAAAAVVAPVFTAAVSGLLPDVLDADRYVLGRSVFNLTGSGTQILGLGIGGALLAAVPARWLLLAAGVSLTLAAAVIRLCLQPRQAREPRGPRGASKPRELQEPPKPQGPRGWRGIVGATLSGHAALFADPVVRGLLLAQWLPAWFATGAEALIIPYTASLGRPASAAGLLLAAVPAGMLLGEVLVGRFCPADRRRRLAFPLVAAMGIPLLAFFFRPPLPLAAVALLIAGLGFAYQLGIQQAFLDSLPEQRRGQAFGLNSTGAMGGQGLVPPAAGALAAVLGAGPAMAIAGVATVLAALALRRPLTGVGRLNSGRSKTPLAAGSRPRA
jgi:MFS family permease